MNQFIVQKLLEKIPVVTDNHIELLVADNGQIAFEMFEKEF